VLIRYGYEITLNCAQPTALVCLLSVHDGHARAIRVPERVFTTPIIPTATYHDLFGNKCRRLVAPAGDLTLWGDATIKDSGQPEANVPDAREVPAADLPDECLVYLKGSRYCETDRLSQAAWDRFGPFAPGWGGRVEAVCDFRPSTHQVRLFAGALDPNGVRDVQGAHRRLPRPRSSRADPLSLPQHPRALRQWPSRRFRRARRRPDGFQRLDRSFPGRPVAHLRSAQQFHGSAESSSRAVVTRPIFRS
jgi:hypothetical protein